MPVTLRLYGPISKEYGAEHTYHVRRPYEALRLLEANYPGSRRRILHEGYALLMWDPDSEEITPVDRFRGEAPMSNEELLLLPIPGGGVEAIVYWTVYFFTQTAIGTALASLAVTAAVSAVVSAIAYALAPKPEEVEAPENKPSYYFTGQVNTTRQGSPVPLCYGKFLTGSTVLSVQITTEDIPV